MAAPDYHIVHSNGHRPLVGATDDALWDSIGLLQFQFLVGQGLRPDHVLVDIACGALRAGVRLIPYLGRGGYLGLDKQIELIIYGVGRELGLEQFAAKWPEFVVSDSFEFHKFSRRPDYAVAQSLFTHLGQEHVRLCLNNLRPQAAPGCRFFATFTEADAPQQNPIAPFQYAFTRAEMEGFGREAGWTPHYIGGWGHPRGQRMIEYRLL